MITTYKLKSKWIFFFSVVILSCSLNLRQTVAQDTQPININEIIQGSLSPESPEQYYSLIARAGQSLDIEIRRVSGEIIPQFAVLRGKQSLGVWYAYKHTTVGDDFAGGQIRFDVDDQYIIRVTSRNPASSEGKFVFSVNAAVPPKNLVIDEIATGEIVGGEIKVFTFQSIPQSNLLVSVELKSSVTDVVARLKNSRGDILGSFQPPLDAGLFNIPEGQNDYTIEITNTSNGSIVQFTILLRSNKPQSSAEVVPNSTNGLPELPNSGDCVVATLSAAAVNIRPDPSLAQPAFAVMSAFKVYRVIGRNQDDTWYQIQDNNLIGWVSAVVTRLGGNCELVPRL